MRDRSREFAAYERLNEMNLTRTECHAALATLWVADPGLLVRILDAVQGLRDRSGS